MSVGGLPANVEVNAWQGDDLQSASTLGEGSLRWALAQSERAREGRTLAARGDEGEWRDPQVGWGLMLPYGEGLSDEALGRVDDAPEALRRLYELRSARVGDRSERPPLFRWSPDSPSPYTTLERYYPDGNRESLSLLSRHGRGPGCIPRYLLICASPAEIPWAVQINWSGALLVGRLDLDETGLNNYVDALARNWDEDDGSGRIAALVCCVVNGPGITSLMRETLALPAAKALAESQGRRCVELLDGFSESARGEVLAAKLKQGRPRLIVSTSHGYTGSLAQPERARERLGALVDGDFSPIGADALLDEWEPRGAVWYSHACCSAGSEGTNFFDGLVTEGGRLDRLFTGLAALGDTSAKSPRVLLGAKHPLRAFVGHVQPTFDLSLRDPSTGQDTGADFLTGLEQTMAGVSLGRAFERVGINALQLRRQHDIARKLYNEGQDNIVAQALTLHLAALDRERMVLLGDPCVSL